MLSVDCTQMPGYLKLLLLKSIKFDLAERLWELTASDQNLKKMFNLNVVSVSLMYVSSSGTSVVINYSCKDV